MNYNRLMRRLVAPVAAGAVLGYAGVKAYEADSYDSHTGCDLRAVRTEQVIGGQTLWGIAKQIDPDHTANSRDIVNEIAYMNGLSSTDIHAGQELILPAEGACHK